MTWDDLIGNIDGDSTASLDAAPVDAAAWPLTGDDADATHAAAAETGGATLDAESDAGDNAASYGDWAAATGDENSSSAQSWADWASQQDGDAAAYGWSQAESYSDQAAGNYDTAAGDYDTAAGDYAASSDTGDAAADG